MVLSPMKESLQSKCHSCEWKVTCALLLFGTLLKSTCEFALILINCLTLQTPSKRLKAQSNSGINYSCDKDLAG